MRRIILLEVMVAVAVAVAVLAVVAGMVHVTLQRHVHNARLLENRALAGWLADTRLAELQLQGASPPSTHEEISDYGHRRWRVVHDIQATAHPNLRLVRVRVTELDGNDGGAVLTGFVGVRQ